MRVRSALIAAAMTLALAGCETTAGPVIVPFAYFNYSGAASGTFDAKGGPTAGDTTKPFAAAYRDAQYDSVVVVAQAARGQDSDLVFIGLHSSGTGSFTLDPACDGHINCGTVVMRRPASTGGAWLCYLEAGTLTTTFNNTSRVTGTFAGSGQCWDSTGASLGAFTVTGGSFDVLIALGSGY